MNKESLVKYRARILEIAEHHDFTVHCYSWSASNTRRLTRRMAADGLLVMVMRTKTHFHYRTKK